MITCYVCNEGSLAPSSDPAHNVSLQSVWIDLLNPTKEEDHRVEAALNVSVPTREEMQEIEHSSRLYAEGGGHFMTATVLFQPEAQSMEAPRATPITFILVGERLVTVRYAEPRAFAIFQARAQKKDVACGSGRHVLLGLLEAIIDREADRIERTQAEVDRVSAQVFDRRTRAASNTRRFDVVLSSIGRLEELTVKSRESLLSFNRLLTYLTQLAREQNFDKSLRERIKTASRDVQSLADHVGFLSQQVSFMLDATLGMIGIQQNNIIKIMSLAAVVFLPPTLIASIYGMNFKAFPEIEWTYGYPMALVLMVISGALPYLYFKRKGWL